MSPLSMTGFGEAEAVVLGRRTRIELRSINHRYLEIRCRLPRTLSSLEARLTAMIKERVQRGKVDLVVTLEETVDAQGLGPMIDVNLARAYWADIEHLAQALGMTRPQPDLALLLGLPDVVRLEESDAAHGEAVWSQLAPALAQALERFAATRRAEGQALGEDLLRRTELLQQLLERVRARAPQALRHHQQKLRERVTRLLEHTGGGRPDEARLAQELALLADRLDIEEELTRLDHHLSSLGRALSGEEPGPLGRRLDFLVQELMREVNTIGAKANDALIADLVVGMKSELERIREQVQNLE